jgi:hypothetical protein
MHILDLTIKDTWNLPTAINVNPQLTSTEMAIPTTINPTDQLLSKYQFYQLIPATYLLQLSYKSFKTETPIDITDDTSETLTFPAEYTINLDLCNSYGMPTSNGHLTIERENKDQRYEITDPKISITIPPAPYTISLEDNNDILAQQPIDIQADKSISIITTEGSTQHSIIMIIGIIILLMALIQFIWKRSLKHTIYLIIIALLTISVIIPWWTLNGESNQTTTTTNTLLYPPKIITLTSTQDIQGGEIAAVPEELTMILSLLSMLVLITIIIFALHLLIPTNRTRINTLMTMITIIILLLITVLFYVAMAQITEIGVGGVIGSGNLDITIPGVSNKESIPCNWGLSLGYYLVVISFSTQILLFIYQRITQPPIKKSKTGFFSLDKLIRRNKKIAAS